MNLVIGDHVKGKGQQCIAGKNGCCLVERLVNRRQTPAEIVIVHGRKIVMNERIAMDHFERRSRQGYAVIGPAEKSRGFHHQDRAQALATAQRRMSHGGKETFRALGLALTNLRGQNVFQDRFDPIDRFRQVCLKLVRQRSVPIMVLLTAALRGQGGRKRGEIFTGSLS